MQCMPGSVYELRVQVRSEATSAIAILEGSDFRDPSYYIVQHYARLLSLDFPHILMRRTTPQENVDDRFVAQLRVLCPFGSIDVSQVQSHSTGAQRTDLEKTATRNSIAISAAARFGPVDCQHANAPTQCVIRNSTFLCKIIGRVKLGTFDPLTVAPCFSGYNFNDIRFLIRNVSGRHASNQGRDHRTRNTSVPAWRRAGTMAVRAACQAGTWCMTVVHVQQRKSQEDRSHSLSALPAAALIPRCSAANSHTGNNLRGHEAPWDTRIERASHAKNNATNHRRKRRYHVGKD